MPIYRTKIISDYSRIGIWKITESTEDLVSMLKKKGFKSSEIIHLKNEQKLQQWLAVRLLIYHFFNNFSLNYDKYGKPYMSNSYLSISHSNHFAVVLANEKKDCGVDIEKISPKIERIRHKFLDADELYEAKSIEDLTVFWGAKEALYKFYGKKELIFNEQLFISRSDTDLSKLHGRIETLTQTVNLKLHYEKIEDCVLVYTL